MKKIGSLLGLGVLTLLLGACGAPGRGSAAQTPAVREFFAMDTFMSVQVWGAGGEAAAAALQTETVRLEGLFSRARAESDITRLNARAGDGTQVPLSPETVQVLAAAGEVRRAVGGTFDVTVAPVMDLWGFGAGGTGCRVPDPQALSRCLALVDGGKLETGDGWARLEEPGMEADLGGIAKGYTAGRLVELLGEYEVSSALLNLGTSTIAAVGARSDGTPWRVALRDPRQEEGQIMVLALSDRILSTSGGYERFFEADGSIYHHILDPRTGWPSGSGLLSVTVVAEDGALSDALSTALYVLGPEAAVDLWRTAGDFECVLCQTDGVVLVTEGLEDQMTFGGEDYGYTCEIVRR